MYASNNLRASRQALFERNLATIKAHNAKEGITWFMVCLCLCLRLFHHSFLSLELSLPSSFALIRCMPNHQKVNDFADLHVETELAAFKGYSKRQGLALNTQRPETFTFQSQVAAQALPTSFDWRAKGAVSPVKDQVRHEPEQRSIMNGER